MDDSKTPELTVDCEFRDLIRPLLKDEYRHLEAALLADGCREPITVWKEMGSIQDPSWKNIHPVQPETLLPRNR